MKAFNKDKALRKLNFRRNKNKYIKIGSIALSCVILLVGIIYFSFAKFTSSSNEYTLIQGKVTASGKDVDILAIYQGETKVSTMPAKDRGWYFDRAECTTGSASWNNTDWTLEVNTSEPTKCTLYFKEGENAVTKVQSIVTGEDSTSTDVIDKGESEDASCTNTLAYDGTSDNNLRYVGSNPCNYVTYNGELWRIIGVMNNMKTGGGTTENLVKIIRNDRLGSYSWDSSEYGINGGYGINQWGESNGYEGADLMRELNYDYLGNIKVGTDSKWYNNSNNSKNTTMPSTTISTTSQSMIEDVVWNLGSQGSNDESTWTPPNMYTYERSANTGKICSSGSYCNDTVPRTSTWTGKVALMYPSDYGYATAGGSTTNRSTCLTTSMYSWNESGVSDCKNNDWLYKASYAQHPLSPIADSWFANRVFYVDSSGSLDIRNAYGNYGVLPSVFLKSSTAITGGTGTTTDPYTLG